MTEVPTTGVAEPHGRRRPPFVVTTCRTDGYHGCAFINTAAESTRGSAAHARTVADKRAVRDWVRELAAQAGADDPEALARELTLILDGGLAAGVLDALPAAARAARALVAASCPPRRARPGAPRPSADIG